MTKQVTKRRYIIFPNALSQNGIFPKCKADDSKGVGKFRFSVGEFGNVDEQGCIKSLLMI